MSFANQALSVEYLLKNANKLEKQVYTIPEALDKEIARLKLESIGVTIDGLSKEQKRYLESWEEGT
jgi:adenosylhomocysteinase